MKNTVSKIENTEELNQNELALIDGGGFWDSTIKLVNEQLDNVSRWCNSL
jgi:bacteriocin-like protein